jgi:hypothetical protein
MKYLIKIQNVRKHLRLKGQSHTKVAEIRVWAVSLYQLQF